MNARAVSLVAPLAQWLRAEAQAGRLPSVHDRGAEAQAGRLPSVHDRGAAAQAGRLPSVHDRGAAAQAGRLPSVHDRGAAAKLRHGECVGAWLSLHELGTAAPQWNELLASPAPEAGRDRGLIYLLPEVLCAYLAQQTGCTPAEAQPLAAELLCELVRQGCAERPHVADGSPGWPGCATGQPDAAQWPWRHWPACTTFPGVGQVYTVVLKLPVLRADAPEAFAAA